MQHTLLGHSAAITRLQYFEMGSRMSRSNLLLSLSADRTISLWDAATALRIHLLPFGEQSPTSAALDATGTVLVVAGLDAVLSFWKLDLLAAGSKPTRSKEIYERYVRVELVYVIVIDPYI